MKHSLRSLVLVGTAFLFSTCAHKEGPGPHTKKVVLAKGPVSSLVKKGAAARNLVKGTVVKNAEIITVGPGGSLEIALVRDTLVADQNSALNIASQPSDTLVPVRVALARGRIFVLAQNREKTRRVFTMHSRFAACASDSGAFSIELTPDGLLVQCLAGNVSLATAGGTTASLQPGYSVFATADQTGAARRLTRENIATLKVWVGEERINRLLKDLKLNDAPVFTSKPRTSAPVGRKFAYTATARDPDGDSVRYAIDKAPSGMTIHKRTGAVAWMPMDTGAFAVSLTDMDNAGNRTVQEFTLFIKPLVGVFAAFACSPALARTQENIVLDASASRGTRPLRSRWDYNNDDIWDIEFSTEKTSKVSYKQPGTYTVRLEVQDKLGQVDVASEQIVVKDPPVATLVVRPASGDTGSSFEINASGSTDPENDRLLYRFDTDNNGAWDNPANGGFGPDPGMARVYGKPGTYTVIVEIQDAYGHTARTSAKVTVVLPPPPLPPDTAPKAKEPEPAPAPVEPLPAPKPEAAPVPRINKPPTVEAGPNIMADEDDKVTLEVTASDSDGTIRAFFFDFDANGIWDTTIEVEKPELRLKHRFAAYTMVYVKAIDSDGATAMDSLKVIMCPQGMRPIEGPYKGALLQYCMDTYEWPNTKKETPAIDVSWTSAQEKCRNTGKRLCTVQEWRFACEGKKALLYPYGNEFDPGKCNTEANGKKLAASGSFELCESGFGVFDLSGNAAEWTQAAGNSQALYGGFFRSKKDFADCSGKMTKGKEEKFFFSGFRCCK